MINLGLVINKDTALHPNAVQVYIYGKDPVIPAPNKDVSKVLFIGEGQDNGAFNSAMLKKLRATCSWAYVMSPVFGGANSVRTDPKSGKVTTSMVANSTEDFNYEGTNHGALPEGAKYNEYGARYDAFADPSLTLTRNCNFAGLDYFPQNYPNSPNGYFSLPEINSYVWVTYIGKSKTTPLIIGTAPRNKDLDLMFNLI